MVLSDRTIRRLLDEGHIEIDPYEPALLQPSSVDVRVDRFFRVFHNARYPFIDVKEPQEDLTELVEIADDAAFILHPGEFVLGSTLERIRLPNDLVARLEGKALALDTEIPTPEGFRLMAELMPGDEVFDEEGRPTTIVAATPPMLGRSCREVKLSDSTTVVCDADHLWATTSKSERRASVWRLTIRSTAEIERSLAAAGGEWNHKIPLARPVQYPVRNLPIDPYVLGVWLGDGTSTKAEITSADEEVLAAVAGAGYAVASQRTRPLAHRIGGVGHTRDARTGRYTRNESLSSRLRDLGLLGSKHIPRSYLESSVEQREALLYGLMDSDGYVDRMGRCDITTVSAQLADDYRELVASLGFRPTVGLKRAKLYGKDCGPRFEVQFVPNRLIFRLPRKLARQRETHFHRFRSIVAIRPVSSVPVRCIQVAAASGLFLATRSYVPTHNSSLGRLGLLIHSTAGFIDPGWDGHVTLELSNVANLPITIYHGMKIGQLSFMQLTEPTTAPYGSEGLGSKYQGQGGPTPSRYWKNFEEGS
jgi:deoxycytidine triphosphate deaminase